MALSQGKSLALLCMLFGMGLALQHASAVRGGHRWPGRYLWRAALLFLDGALNYLLIAEFDVLMGYAVTAALVSWMLLTSRRMQRLLCAGFAAAHVLVVVVASGLAFASGAGDTQRAWSGANPYADGSFVDLVGFRLANIVIFRAEPVFIAFGSVALFLLGVRLLRAGIFTEQGAGLRRILLVLGGVALPVDLALGTAAGLAGVLLERYLVAPLVALGVLALVAEYSLRRGAHGWAARRLREVGRAALSCYLLQNLLAGAVFYGWGLGLADQLGAYRVPVTLVAYAGVAGLVVASAHVWLRHFRLGPVEWLWRRLGNVGATR